MPKKYKYPTYQLRLPPELKAALEDVARKNERSLNSEITHRLEKSLEADEQAAAALAGDPHQQINVLTEQMGQMLKAVAAANALAAVESGRIQIEETGNNDASDNQHAYKPD